MDIDDIVDDIASRADDLLDGITSRDEARSTLLEVVQKEFPSLAPLDRKTVVTDVIEILDAEEFFDSAPGEGSGDDDEDGDED